MGAKKSAARKNVEAALDQAEKAGAAKAAKPAPAKRAAAGSPPTTAAPALPDADALEARLAGLETSSAVVTASTPAEPPAPIVMPNGLHVDTTLTADPQPPDEADAEASIQETAVTPLSTQVARALRFIDKTTPYVRVYPNTVVGTGPFGTVYSPWNVPGLTAHVVDGLKLHRALRRIGASATVSAHGGGGLEVRGGGKKYVIQPYGDVVPDPLPFPPQDTRWTTAKPAAFRQASVFAGDEKIEPPYLMGVGLVNGAALATDRRTAFVARDFADATLPPTVIPPNAFEGIDDPAVYLALTAEGRITIGIPSTGEYRILRALHTGSFPDVVKMVDMHAGAVKFVLDIPKAELADALASMVVVQSRLSSVKLTVQRAFGDAGETFFLRVAGGIEDMASCETAFPVKLVAGALVDNQNLNIHVNATYLGKAVKAALGENLRIGFSDHMSPLVIDEPSYRALMLPFVL